MNQIYFYLFVTLVLISIQPKGVKTWFPFRLYSKAVKVEKLLGNEDGVGDPLLLTPLLKEGRLNEARKLSRVKNLTNVISYSGFLTVNELYDSNLFFWFFPAAFHPEKAPVLLWLQGGLGASSLIGLFDENGPFVIDSEHNINFRNTAWTLTHSVLYIDNPVGSGFSFTKSDQGYAKSEEDVAADLYSALLQFFLMFHKYQPNDFYITGESYGGKYVPAIALKIHQESRKAAIKINLKGLAIGNGYSDPVSMLGHGDYLYNIGLLDYNGKLYFNEEEGKAAKFIEEEKYLDAFNVMDKLLLVMNTQPSYYEEMTGFKGFTNFIQPVVPPEIN